jgi:polyhydroxyalkanoate synthesis regulator phasin
LKGRRVEGLLEETVVARVCGVRRFRDQRKRESRRGGGIMTEEQENRRERPREGFSAWMGVLDAFREAIEETIVEMRERKDLTPERAREAVRTTMQRAQSALDDARERLDFVPRREFDALQEEVGKLRRRVDALDGGGEARAQIPVEGA